jgi:cytochrome c oxidase subunit 4
MFFEDPALLVGIPLIAIGVIGVLVAVGAVMAPDEARVAAQGTGVAAAHGRHPDEAEYVRVGLILAFITAIEVAIYYVNIQRNLFITVLVVMSLAKFATVVLWFMHLKFDSRLFTTAFVTGLVLALAVFSVVLVTLGSNIV